MTPLPKSGRRPVSGQVDAPLDDVTLAYAGSTQVAHEGEVILF